MQATPSNQAEATPGVGALDFAHFANGEGIISDLVLMNGAAGSAHDLDPRARGADDGIGAGGLGRSHRRSAPL